MHLNQRQVQFQQSLQENAEGPPPLPEDSDPVQLELLLATTIGIFQDKGECFVPLGFFPASVACFIALNLTCSVT
jgi:hypothetical protein